MSGRYGPTAEPPPPPVTYERVTLVRPVQEFTYVPFETWKLAGRSVGTAYYPVCPPAIVLLVRAEVAPKPPIDRIYVPPHCNPARITIGRVSTLDAWRYPLRVKWGTAESRKR